MYGLQTDKMNTSMRIQNPNSIQLNKIINRTIDNSIQSFSSPRHISTLEQIKK